MPNSFTKCEMSAISCIRSKANCFSWRRSSAECLSFGRHSITRIREDGSYFYNPPNLHRVCYDTPMNPASTHTAR